MKSSFVSCLTFKEEKKIISITLNSESKIHNNLISIGKDTFIKDYYHFFSKENIYILFQRIFHRTILNYFLKNFSNWKFKKIKTFQKIFFGLLNYFNLFPRNYLKMNSISQIKKLSKSITPIIYWKIFYNTLRNQILRNNSLSVRFTFISLQFFKFWFHKPSNNEKLEFLFSRINFTEKNQNLNLLIFRLLFYVYLFNFKKKNNSKLKFRLLDILFVNIINGKMKGRENFYLRLLKITSSLFFKLDNYYQVLKIFFFLEQFKKYNEKKKKNLKYNFNSILWKTKKFYCLSRKNFIYLKIKNLSNFLTNLNGVDFPKFTSIEVWNSNSMILKQANLIHLKNINNRRLTFNGIETKIFIGIIIIKTFLKNQLFEKNNFESFKNKFFSTIKKQNNLKKDAKKFPPILIFNKTLVKMFNKKSFFSKILFSHSIFFTNTWQEEKILSTKKVDKNSSHFKIFLWDFKNKITDKIRKFLNFFFLLFYSVVFASQIKRSNFTVSGYFSIWNITSIFRLLKRIPKGRTKLINIKELKINLNKIKNLQKDLKIKVENHFLFSKEQFNVKNYNIFHHFLKRLYMVFFLSTNSKFLFKSFRFQNKKSNFYLFINSVIKNFYIFQVKNDFRRNFDFILKKNFRDNVHFRHSRCKLFLENYYDFEILFDKLIV
jgi:hypothetical protein